MKKLVVGAWVLAWVLPGGWGCRENKPTERSASKPGAAPERATPAEPPTRLRLATTTSTDNSGLLKVLLPPFERANRVRVDVIAVGTGKALKLARRGDVDVVLVHARAAEDQFVADGFGVDRRDVMYNDFVVVGPPRDPAGVGDAASAVEAFKLLARAKAAFVSRGDDSGTHKAEKRLWKAAGIEPKGSWYVSAGRGMGDVLVMADELGAYTLTDRGTFVAFRDRLDLKIVSQGDRRYFNPYGIIAVNPKRHPHVRYDLAEKLIAFVTGPEGQKIIAGFRKGGRQLFFPNTVPPKR